MGWSARLAAAAVGMVSLGVIGVAGAHSDPCHSRHTCPSDHHTYVWTDPGTGTGWWCVQPGSPEQTIYDRTAISWGGRTYLCYWGAGAPPPDPGPYPALPQATAPVAPQIATVTDADRRPTVTFAVPDGWTPQVAQIAVDPGPDAGFTAPSSVVAFGYLAPGQTTWAPGNQLPPGINYYVRITAVPPTDQCELGICAPVYSSVVGFRTSVQPAVVPTPVAPGPTITPEAPAPTPTPTATPTDSRFTIDFSGATIRGRGVIKPGMTVGAMEARWGFASWDEPDFRATGYNSAAVTIEYRAGRRITWISAYHSRWSGPEGITVGMTPANVQRRLGTRVRWVKSRHWFAGRGIGRRQAYVVQGRYAVGFAIARGRVEAIILGPASGIRQYMTWYGPI